MSDDIHEDIPTEPIQLDLSEELAPHEPVLMTMKDFTDQAKSDIDNSEVKKALAALRSGEPLQGD